MAKGKHVNEESEKYGKPKPYDPDFHGPLKNRSCTDIICLVLLITFLAGWGVISYFAFANGNMDRLIYPTDSRGQICGRKDNNYDYTSKPYLFYFDVTKCLTSGTGLFMQGCRTPSVCVQQCPDFYWSPAVGSAPDGTNSRAKFCMNGNDDNNLGNCPPYIVPSSAIAGRCIPIPPDPANTTTANLVSGLPVDVTPEKIKNGSTELGKFLGARETMEKIFQDFRASWWMILVGLVFAMIISFIWIVIMRWVAGPMVWLGLATVIGLLSYGTFYCFTTWNTLRQKPGQDPAFEFSVDPDSYLTRRDTWLAFGIIAAIVLAIVLLITMFLRNRLRLAVALLQEASKGVSNMMFTLLWPLVPFILQLAVFAFWGLLAILLSSAGQTNGILIRKIDGTPLNRSCNPLESQNDTENCIFSSYNSDTKYTYFHLYNVFALFWLGFFVVGVSDLSLAGAFASFYWTRNKAKDMPTFPLAGSVGRCFRYHLGSVAFGSLIIAIVRFVRWLLEQLDQKLKQSHLGFARFLVKCCACCLWCLEKFLKFVNKNAYIMIAIYGKNFCRSARDAFQLLMRNVVRVVILDKVTDFLLFLGKLVIVSGIGIFAVHFFEGAFDSIFPKFLQSPSQMNYIAVPITTVIVGSYLIASAFFGVYAMAVDTLFLCFLEDLERNDGTAAKPYFMSKNLMRILGKKNKKDKKLKQASSEPL